MSKSMTTTFLSLMANVAERFMVMKVFPELGLMDVTNITFLSLPLSMNSMFVRITLKASFMMFRVLGFTSMRCSF